MTGDRMKRDVLRMLKSAMVNKAIELRHELDQTEFLQVVAKECKKRQDSIDSYVKVGETARAAKEGMEKVMLAAYMPPVPTEGEIETIVSQAISKLEATSRKQMGDVMKLAKEMSGGNIPGQLLSKEVQKQLPQ